MTVEQIIRKLETDRARPRQANMLLIALKALREIADDDPFGNDPRAYEAIGEIEAID